MTSWIRSANKPICIHMSNNIVQEGWQRGIFCHPLQVARPKPCKQDIITSWVSFADVDVWWMEGMELGKVWFLSCQVPSYPRKFDRIQVPRPWSRIKSLISVEWNQMWQVVHSSSNSDKYERDFNAVVAFPTQYIDKRGPTPSVIVFITKTRPSKMQKTSASFGTFKGKIEFRKYSWEQCDSMSMAQRQQTYEL